MKLVTVEAGLAPDCVAKSIAIFNNQARAVRAMHGCQDYAIYEAPNGENAILIMQKWASMKDFDAYRQSDLFASMGAGLGPLMAGPPVTTVAEID